MRLSSLHAMAICIALVATASQSSWGHYYYAAGTKVSLKVDSSKITVRFRDNVSKDARGALLDSIGGLTESTFLGSMVDRFRVYTLSAKRSFGDFFDSLREISSIEHVEYFYLGESGVPMTVGNRFCVGFNEDVKPEEISRMAATYGVEQVYEIDGMPNTWVMRNPAGSERRLLDVANSFYGMKGVRYSHPLFGVRPQLNSYRTYDFYRSYQYNIARIAGQLDTCTIWDYAGLTRPVVVAVLDGLVKVHEDLPSARVLPGADFAPRIEIEEEMGYAPFEGDFHGEACAGIIAASHTVNAADSADPNTGIISIAPYVRILPVRIFRGSVGATADSIAAAITWAKNHGAEVMNCSWGYPDGQTIDVIANAINSAISSGRNGKGCVLVFASGNGGGGPLYFPAWMTGVLSVGAVDSLDVVWSYSQRDATLDIVAPSGDVEFQGVPYGDIWSTDLMAAEGGNPSIISDCDEDYFCHFGGTSAAAPIVSGVAALLLSRDSMLSATGVSDIIANSAARELSWGTITPKSPEDIGYGWGLVNPFDAILSISRGDISNTGGVIDLSDLVSLISYLTGGGFVPFPSILLGDCNCDSSVDLYDLSHLVAYLTGNGVPPIRPCAQNDCIQPLW